MKLNVDTIGQTVLYNLNEIQNFLEKQIDESKDDVIYRIDRYYEVHDIYNTLSRSLNSDLSTYRKSIPDLLSKAQKLIKKYTNSWALSIKCSIN
ncbi:MAG: hypothetical protein ACK5Z5_05075 [Neisseriaceae bacterium]